MLIEYYDILLINRENGQNVCLAREYNIYFPESKRPDKNILSWLIHHVYESGSIMSDRKVYSYGTVHSYYSKTKKQFC